MILCAHCHTYRPDGEGPCPYCGGAAVATGGSNGASSDAAVSLPSPGPSLPGASGTEWSTQSLMGYWQQAGGTGVSGLTGAAERGSGGLGASGAWPSSLTPEATPQVSFPGSEQQSFASGLPTPALSQEAGASLLPMPYQPAAGNGKGQGSTQSLVLFPPGQAFNSTALLPLVQQPQMPGAPIAGIPMEEGALYIPPMYTKPRPLIPRYRAISGLISFVVVILLLCSGAAYYARVTGKFAVIGQLFGMAPPSIAATPVPHLPDPKADETGPAYGIISSATTAPSVDPKTGIALQPSQIFQPGQTVYLTYSVHAKKAGTVTVKWYTNGLLYEVLSKDTPDPKGGSWTGVSSMRFMQPLEGMIELYWNDAGQQPQLAIRLYFVVR
jgi:hypothetical protein